MAPIKRHGDCLLKPNFTDESATSRQQQLKPNFIDELATSRHANAWRGWDVRFIESRSFIAEKRKFGEFSFAFAIFDFASFFSRQP